MNTDIDCLLIENFFLIKEKQNNNLIDDNFKDSFEKRLNMSALFLIKLHNRIAWSLYISIF